MTKEELKEKTELIESYLAWLSTTHPETSKLIAYVDILDDGSIDFVTNDDWCEIGN